MQTTWGRPRSKPVEPAYKALIEGVREGLTFFCLHFNAPGELELIEPRAAYIRTEEYDVFRDQGFRDWLLAQDLDIIGMKPLRDELRATLSAGEARKFASANARGSNRHRQRSAKWPPGPRREPACDRQTARELNCNDKWENEHEDCWLKMALGALVSASLMAGMAHAAGLKDPKDVHISLRGARLGLRPLLVGGQARRRRRRRS